jgi:hypothetical protein
MPMKNGFVIERMLPNGKWVVTGFTFLPGFWPAEQTPPAVSHLKVRYQLREVRKKWPSHQFRSVSFDPCKHSIKSEDIDSIIEEMMK